MLIFGRAYYYYYYFFFLGGGGEGLITGILRYCFVGETRAENKRMLLQAMWHSAELKYEIPLFQSYPAEQRPRNHKSDKNV